MTRLMSWITVSGLSVAVPIAALLTAVLSVATVPSAIAAEGESTEAARPPWLSDEVVTAAMGIGLTDEQLAPFRASVTQFLEEYRDEARRIIRRADAGIEGNVLRARNTLARQMDERMAGFLSEAQMVPYQDYRAALLKSLSQD